MVQGLKLYTPAKAAAQQCMTFWDHKVVLWMENLMATAYGVAPIVAMTLPTRNDVPQPFLMKEDGKTPQKDDKDQPIKNPKYGQEVYELGKRMTTLLPELLTRQELAKCSSDGFNILLELLRKERNMNFANEVSLKNFKSEFQNKN